MATRRLVTRDKGRLPGIRSVLRVANNPAAWISFAPPAALRLQPLPVTAPAVVLPLRRRGRNPS